METKLEMLKMSWLILLKKLQHLQLIKISTNISKILEETWLSQGQLGQNHNTGCLEEISQHSANQGR